jgi:UDP-glucose 4-epimerase
MEVIKAFESANQIKFDIRLELPRQGDPAQVVANNEMIFKESNWRPKYNDISVICKTTYEWIKSGIERT